MGLTGLMKKLFEEEDGHKNTEEETSIVKEDEADQKNEDIHEEADDEFMLDEEEDDFLLRIEDTFALKEKGCVIAGKVLRGSIRSGDTVSYTDEEMNKMFECHIQAIEQNHYEIGQATAAGNYGAHYGFLISDHDKEAFKVGNYLLMAEKIINEKSE